MSNTVIVRYTTRPDAAEENQRLIEQVYAELAATDPGGLHYVTFKLADGVTFVHIGIVEGDTNPLDTTVAFKEFTSGVGSRCVAPPVASSATRVGAYRFPNS